MIYLGRQASGQIEVLYKAEPVNEYLKKDEVPQWQKEKLLLIEDIRQFTEDSLGLNQSNNYQKIYDQNGEPILWTVNACDQFSLNPYQWWFPVIGKVSYKGFFDYKLAEKEASQLKDDGYDVSIHEVAAWSTLGFLNDPILSSFLERDPGSLANLVIHELTHGTLFVSGDVNFNESLASFIGDKGAVKWLEATYGPDSKELNDYLSYKKDREVFIDYVLDFSTSLDSFYQDMEEKSLSVPIREIRKAQAMTNFINGFKSLPFNSERYIAYFEEEPPNNVFFMHYIRYQKGGNDFDSTLQADFNGDISAYIQYLKGKHRHVKEYIPFWPD
jgi:predicted aminopeptidase